MHWPELRPQTRVSGLRLKLTNTLRVVTQVALTGIRSPDRPARTESLFRLSYPGPSNCFTYSLYLKLRIAITWEKTGISTTQMRPLFSLHANCTSIKASFPAQWLGTRHHKATFIQSGGHGHAVSSCKRQTSKLWCRLAFKLHVTRCLEAGRNRVSF
jgi:hypothetical protein